MKFNGSNFNFGSGFWGKAQFDPVTDRLVAWHPLEDHCLDVAVTFRTLVELPTFKVRLSGSLRQILSATQLDRLAVIALLHDIGKCNLGFQDKILRTDAPRAGHIRELAPLLFEPTLGERLVTALDEKTFLSWFENPETALAYRS